MSTSTFLHLLDSLLQRGGNTLHKACGEILCGGLTVVKRAHMLFCVPMLSTKAVTALTRHIAQQQPSLTIGVITAILLL
jgi:hypothetical protein